MVILILSNRHDFESGRMVTRILYKPYLGVRAILKMTPGTHVQIGRTHRSIAVALILMYQVLFSGFVTETDKNARRQQAPACSSSSSACDLAQLRRLVPGAIKPHMCRTRTATHPLSSIWVCMPYSTRRSTLNEALPLYLRNSMWRSTVRIVKGLRNAIVMSDETLERDVDFYMD